MGSAAVGCSKGKQYTIPQTLPTVAKASAPMNAVSRKRLGPLDIASGAIIPTHRPTAAADLHPTYAMRTPMCELAPPPYLEGVQRVPHILHTRCTQLSLEVRGHLRWCQRQIPFISVFSDAREQEN